MFRNIILTVALTLTSLPVMAQESWSSGEILTEQYLPQAQIRSYQNHAPAFAPDRSSIIAHPVFTGAQINAAGSANRFLPMPHQFVPQRALPVMRNYGYQSARSLVRGGQVQYRAAEPGGTAFESGPGTETTVIQRGPDGVAVTVIYNP